MATMQPVSRLANTAPPPPSLKDLQAHAERLKQARDTLRRELGAVAGKVGPKAAQAISAMEKATDIWITRVATLSNQETGQRLRDLLERLGLGARSSRPAPEPSG